MDNGVVVVGGGVSGLACARGLAAAGRGAVVVERASRVGGRCASRPFDGQLVDYGPLFFHGHQPAFLAALDAGEGAPPRDRWPGRAPHGWTAGRAASAARGRPVSPRRWTPRSGGWPSPRG